MPQKQERFNMPADGNNLHPIGKNGGHKPKYHQAKTVNKFENFILLLLIDILHS